MNDNIGSPFSYDLGEELFPLPSLSCIDIPVPQFPSISPLDNNKSGTQKPKNGRRKKPPANSSDDIGDMNPNEHKKKKIMHRDVERQRRQDMASLYATLRSLLPHEYLKGKRSICDHMLEAVKYIRHMQSRIQVLCNKRDELKRVSDKNPVATMVETLDSSKRDSVLVRARNESGGVQVVLNTATQHNLPVSNILRDLATEGLEILSYISTKVNDSFIHTIECQTLVDSNHTPSIDVSELQHKLMNLEYFLLN
ncbi:transcription factor bHLH118-like [Cucurbita moschata]|uniref:Transcription factor bHLH118-like n=2 Tax=Cucurbita TaxID=3660 RepID=A0A6J1H558_CUCMO